MSTKTGKEYFDSSINIIQFAVKRWKTLIGVAVVAAVMGIVFSGPKFIAPKFTSNAVVYPANLGSYAGETGLEQLQQYLESNEIRDTLINKFNLIKEYEIDTTSPTYKSDLYKAYNSNIDFDETEFESISINATSTNPEKAKDMVVEIINQLNHIIRRTEREKYKEVMVINKRLMEQKRAQLDSLELLIHKYSTKYGLLDYTEQSEEVTEGYLQFLLDGKKGDDYEEVKELYDNLKKYGRAYHNIHAQLNEVNSEYMRRLHSYEHSLKDYQKVQTYTNILVKPEVPDKKSSPVRSVIVLAATAAAVLFTFATLLVLGYNNRG